MSESTGGEHEPGTTVRQWIAQARIRLMLVCAAYGASAGVAIAAMLRLSGWPPPLHVVHAGLAPSASLLGLTLLLAAGGALLAVVAVRRSPSAVAAYIERQVPACRNIVVTAEELLRSTAHAPGSVHALVMSKAADALHNIDVRSVVPARRALVATVGALGLYMASGTTPVRTSVTTVRESLGGTTTPAVRSIQIEISPPPYTALLRSTERDPSRVAVVAGSRVRVIVDARASDVAMETMHGVTMLSRPNASRQRGSVPGGSDRREVSSGEFVGEFVADVDGFLALEPRVQNDSASHIDVGPRRLIGLSVQPDGTPRVQLVAPGRDVRLETSSGTLALRVSADDDFGLSTLKLRYTKVTGSGERFSFNDGELPLVLSRRDAKSWNATGTFDIGALALEPGDMVVYRAVATDKRPGATPVESDSYIIELAALGALAAPGFAIDNEQDRYALSQQMVILKTQRLLDRRSTMTSEAFAEQALELASEQRRVRAEFVFMMGGELADEVTSESSMTELNETDEAEAEGDLAAGRMENQGRVALLRAIRRMSRASTSLTSRQVPEALVDEKRALVEIERAFSRTRIILRALTERESLDMTRRRSGNLTGVTSDARAPLAPTPDDVAITLRSVLVELRAVQQLTGARLADASVRLTRAAQRLLQLDASRLEIQAIASQLTASSAASTRGDAAASRAEVDRAAVGMNALLHTTALRAQSNASSVRARALVGRLRDAAARGGPIRGGVALSRSAVP